MKEHNANKLKELVAGLQRSAHAPAPTDAQVLDLISTLRRLTPGEHEDILADLRAEAFWSTRAAALNEEVLALRPLEKFAKLALNGAKLTADHVDDLKHALAKLDAVRHPIRS